MIKYNLRNLHIEMSRVHVLEKRMMQGIEAHGGME